MITLDLLASLSEVQPKVWWVVALWPSTFEMSSSLGGEGTFFFW